jgi:hypothetical protein
MTQGQNPFIVGGKDFSSSDSNNNRIVDPAEVRGFNDALRAAGLPEYNPTNNQPPNNQPPNNQPPNNQPPNNQPPNNQQVPPSNETPTDPNSPAPVPDPDITKKNADKQRAQQEADNYATQIAVDNAEDKMENKNALTIAEAALKAQQERDQVFKA